MRKLPKKLLFGLLFTTLLLFSLTLVSCSNHPGSAETKSVKTAALNLANDDQEVRKEAITFLESQGSMIVPTLIEVMVRNQNVDSFVSYEIVSFADGKGVEFLPVLQQGLADLNPTTQRRSARAVATLGSTAASTVPALAKIVENIDNPIDLRTQAVDALRVIKVSTPEVERALALALGGDMMMAWNVTRAITALEIELDSLIEILFSELENEKTQAEASLALSRNIARSSNPLAFLKKGITHSDPNVRQQVINITAALYQEMPEKAADLSKLLLQCTMDESLALRLQAIYTLGEKATKDLEVTRALLDIYQDSQASDEIRLEVAYALEKIDTKSQEVIHEFAKLLIDETADYEQRMIAARYLARQGVIASSISDYLINNLALLDDELRWQLSPLFFHVAMEEQSVLNKIVELTAPENPDELVTYGIRLLSALDKHAKHVLPVDRLLDIIKENKQEELRLAALRALVQVQPDFNLNQLCYKLLADKNKNLAQIAANYLGIKPVLETPEKVLAFPEAEGFGAYTTGGRGGKVYVVTNLNDRGPGSLREAVEAKGPRIVIFNVSGTIHLESPLNIDYGDITIAGQTAPGEGITIHRYTTNVNADNVIIRHLRFRKGDESGEGGDALRGRYIKDVIVDSVSASWGIEQTLTFYAVENFTLQWSLISESLWNSYHPKGLRAYAGIWGGKGASFHHNLMAHHASRTPRFSGGGDVHTMTRDPEPDLVDFRNNVIYNRANAYGGEFGSHNVVNNYYKQGPASYHGGKNDRIVGPTIESKWYVTGNYVDGYPKITADNWAGGVHYSTGAMSDYRVDTPFPYAGTTTHSAEKAYELVLEKAGATLPKRDPIDRRVVHDTRTSTATYGGETFGLGTGIIDSQTDTEGLPFLRNVAPALDSNDNGIPDWWAIKYGFNPYLLDVNDDIDNDGYTNIEEYLNGTNPDLYNL